MSPIRADEESDEEFQAVASLEEDEDDSDIVESSGDEDDDERPTKRSKFAKNDFFVMEAEVDNDAEEDDDAYHDDDDIIAEEEGIDFQESSRDQDVVRSLHRRFELSERFSNDDDAEKINEYFVQKYGRDRDDLMSIDSDGSASDSCVFAVKCRMGEERSTGQLIMSKFMNERDPSAPIKRIRSVVVRDGIRGYIYVETVSSSVAASALADFPTVASRLDQMQMLPKKQAAQILIVQGEENLSLVTGSFVRVYTGLYRGDLGVIESADNEARIARVKLVPRIDYNNRKSSLFRNSSGSSSSIVSTPSSGRGGLKRRAMPNRGAPPRPAARLFDATALRALGFEFKRERNLILFERQQYTRTGLLLKSFPFHHLRVCNSKDASQSELEPFKYELTVDTKKNNEIKEVSISESVTSGDRVLVVDGEFKGRIGMCSGVTEDGLLMVQIEGTCTRIQADSAERAFMVGDYVKIEEKEGQGLVIASDINQKTASIILDQVSDKTDIPWNQLKLTKVYEPSKREVVDITGKFSIGDMVTVSGNQFGALVGIQGNTFSVLMSSGFGKDAVSTFPRSAVRIRPQRGDPCCKDHLNQTVRIGDQVKLLCEGSHRGRVGVVKHIIRTSVFIHNPEIASNTAGMVMIDASELAVASDESKDESDDETFGAFNLLQKSPGSNHYDLEERGFMSRMRSLQQRRRSGALRNARGNRSTRGSARFSGRDYKLIGKTVRVVTGQFKGQLGMVKDANCDIAHVEIQTLYQTLPFKRHEVVIHDDRDSQFTSALLTNVDVRSSGSQSVSQTKKKSIGDSGCSTPFTTTLGTPIGDMYKTMMTGNDDWNPQDMLTPGFQGTPSSPEMTNLSRIHNVQPKTPAISALSKDPDTGEGEGYGQRISGEDDEGGYGRSSEPEIKPNLKRKCESKEIKDDEDGYGRPSKLSSTMNDGQDKSKDDSEEGYGRPSDQHSFGQSDNEKGYGFSGKGVDEEHYGHPVNEEDAYGQPGRRRKSIEDEYGRPSQGDHGLPVNQSYGSFVHDKQPQREGYGANEYSQPLMEDDEAYGGQITNESCRRGSYKQMRTESLPRRDRDNDGGGGLSADVNDVYGQPLKNNEYGGRQSLQIRRDRSNDNFGSRPRGYIRRFRGGGGGFGHFSEDRRGTYNRRGRGRNDNSFHRGREMAFRGQRNKRFRRHRND
ncbi:hypothetical protein ACOME3_000242 [Neoechinorhynchus agilis]